MLVGDGVRVLLVKPEQAREHWRGQKWAFGQHFSASEFLWRIPLWCGTEHHGGCMRREKCPNYSRTGA